MPPVEVQTEGQLGQRVTTCQGLGRPLGKARLDARLEAGEIAVAAVDDAPCGVHQEGLEQPVVPDVGDQLLERLAAYILLSTRFQKSGARIYYSDMFLGLGGGRPGKKRDQDDAHPGRSTVKGAARSQHRRVSQPVPV